MSKSLAPKPKLNKCDTDYILRVNVISIKVFSKRKMYDKRLLLIICNISFNIKNV